MFCQGSNYSKALPAWDGGFLENLVFFLITTSLRLNNATKTKPKSSVEIYELCPPSQWRYPPTLYTQSYSNELTNGPRQLLPPLLNWPTEFYMMWSKSRDLSILIVLLSTRSYRNTYRQPTVVKTQAVVEQGLARFRSRKDSGRSDPCFYHAFPKTFHAPSDCTPFVFFLNRLR